GTSTVTETQTATVAQGSGIGTVNDSFSFTGAGVYTATLTVTDDDLGEATSESSTFVVYDPSEGFVTGGGWINSPAGAVTAEPTLTGKANFGFVSKYKKGATTPTGNTVFQFKIADLKFKSTSYDWLVVAGARAQYKGSGTINGTGNYGFMLTAIDSAIGGGGDVDKFRIKIWDKDIVNGENVVYDNQTGDGDDADPSTTLGGGSIIIHTQGQSLLAETSGNGGDVILLTQADAEAFTAYALQLWTSATGDVPTIPLQVVVADLPGNQLGSTDGHTITLDTDAAGIGWFIDATAGDNIEFQQYDLLSAAVHEVGHALGYSHSNDGVMSDTLAVGKRRLPVFDADPTEPVSAVDTDPVFLIDMQDSATVVNDSDDESPILTQPVYAETSDYALNGDVPDSDVAESTDDTPLAILPDDEYDGLFTNLDGSLLDELLSV
ncbi:MAG: matrixin family metalloprotease, partial [Planctomycetes bacterium]|nr:matrixin family metalloprotease [Planctomycetota bacterium]